MPFYDLSGNSLILEYDMYEYDKMSRRWWRLL